mgnify:FL=1
MNAVYTAKFWDDVVNFLERISKRNGHRHAMNEQRSTMKKKKLEGETRTNKMQEKKNQARTR